MDNTVRLLLCVVIVATRHISARTEVNKSQLSSRIIGRTYPTAAEALYTASLRVNEVHICCAGMFKPGFLISSGKCVAKLKNQLKDSSRRGFAVLGHKDLEKGERCDILGLKVHPYFDTVKEVDKNWNRDVGIVMVEVPDYMMSLHFPTLQAERPESIRKMNGTLCGWDNTTADSLNASLRIEDFPNNLRCMELRIQSAQTCRNLEEKVVIDFKKKHMCGLADDPMLAITLSDDGGPLIMKVYKNCEYHTYIAGVATDRIEDDDGVYIRFLRTRFVYQQIIEMVKILTLERAENVDHIRNNQQDLLSRPIKRQKVNTEE